MAEREMKYLAYRCFTCGRLITKYQMLAAWEKAEQSGEDRGGVCSCGSGKVSPTNPSLFEELTRPSVWRLWIQDVVWPWLKGKF